MAKPKLALIPAAQGSKFYSVLPSDGVGDFDFARASAATRINKYGLIETVASGQSRLNYPLIDGVVNGCPHHILEPQRINLITQSESFDNAYWSKTSSSVVSGFTSPKGDLSAFKLVEGGATSSHYIGTQAWATTSISGQDYTISCFAKKGENSFIQLTFSGATHNPNNCANFDIENGVLGTVLSGTSKIQALSNGWYRCSFTSPTINTLATSQSFICKIESATSVRAESYTGDGTSGIYIWGAQLEAGSYPTSHIVSNSGSATTRVAETANNSGDASTFNDSEGVLMVEGSIAKDENVFRNISISDGSSNNFVTFYTTNVLNKITYLLGAGGGGAVFGLDYYFQDITINFKIALVYSSGRNEIWVNGIKVNQNTDTFSSMSGLNELSFDNGVSGGNWYGNTKQIQYFDSALNDSELETLTSWTSFSEMATSQLYSIQ
jgi:hypothetical protein